MRSQIRDVQAEMIRQRDLWGEQNHPSFIGNLSWWLDTEDIRVDNYHAVSAGTLTWELILLEEVAEAMDERTDPVRLRQELVQVAAVALSWIECLDRNA